MVEGRMDRDEEKTEREGIKVGGKEGETIR